MLYFEQEADGNSTSLLALVHNIRLLIKFEKCSSALPETFGATALHSAQMARIRCELEEYHGYHRRYGDIAEKAFRVEVEEKDEERTSTPRAYPRHNPPPPPRVATK